MARVVAVGVLAAESGEAVPVPGNLDVLLRPRFKLATRTDSSASSQLVKGEDINGRKGEGSKGNERFGFIFGSSLEFLRELELKRKKKEK